MNMKKIIAGVAAAALTATSLAVVSVSADETRTFSLQQKTNVMKVNYSQTVEFIGGKNLTDVFTQGEKVEFGFKMDAKSKDGYEKIEDVNSGWEYAMITTNNSYGGPTGGPGGNKAVTFWNNNTASMVSYAYPEGIKVVIEGTMKDKDAVVTTSASAKRVATNSAVMSLNPVGFDGDNKVVLEAGDIDVSKIDRINKVTISGVLDIAMDTASLSKKAVNLNVQGVQQNTTTKNLADSIFINSQWTDDFTNNWSTSAGTAILTSPINQNLTQHVYSFEAIDRSGVAGAGNIHTKLLTWVNDNIVQNKGAKLRVNFSLPSTAGDVHEDWGYGPGYNPGVLVPGSSESQAADDVIIGVNLNNTTKLQQAANIDLDTLSAEFDWDKLIKDSMGTISGNVDSIAIKVVKTNTVVNNLETEDGKVIIKSVEVIIPDQTNIPGAVNNDPVRIIQAGSDDTFVKVIGTENSIYGNGAVELKVANNITNNSVSYDVKLLDANGAYVQPAGEITLQLSIPTDFQGRKLSSTTVKHTLTDGTVETLNIENADTYTTDKYVTVKTSKFSAFELGFEEEETTTEAPETTTEAPVETTTEAPAETTAAPAQASGDKNANTGVAIAIVPAVIAAAGVIISKKRK